MLARGVSHDIIEQLVDAPGSPFHPLGLPDIPLVCRGVGVGEGSFHFHSNFSRSALQ